MAAAPAAQINTAPAATSFAFSTSGWKSGDATSHRNSSAVLRHSAVLLQFLNSSTKSRLDNVQPQQAVGQQARAEYHEGGDGVNPGVVLRAQHGPHAPTGIHEAPKAGAH